MRYKTGYFRFVWVDENWQEKVKAGFLDAKECAEGYLAGFRSEAAAIKYGALRGWLPPR